MTEPKWLELARQDLGIHEIAGPTANPRIMAYFKAAGADWAKDDSVPWCGAAMAAWVSLAGCPVPAESARARAWLDWGTPLETPRPGCVTVFQRGGDPKSGHVALFLEDRGDRIDVLGGNQGDAVSITSFPKRDIIGYRWPPGAEMPSEQPAATVETVPDKPLRQSNTVWGVVLAFLAFVAEIIQHVVTFVVGISTQWMSAVQSLGPVRDALLSAGGNAKAISAGIGSAGLSMALSARLKAKLGGKAG